MRTHVNLRLVPRRVVLALISVVAACHPDAPTLTEPRSASLLQEPRSALIDPLAVVAAAVSGARRYAEHDNMLRVEAQLAGFGGFYVDSMGSVVVVMKRGSLHPANRVRDVLYRAYAARKEPDLREVMSVANHARVITGDYSLSELIAFENRVIRSNVRIPGLVGVATSVFRNRLKLGFVDSASAVNGVYRAAEAGVPRDAFIAEVWGQPRVTVTWGAPIRPTRGGISTMIANETAVPRIHDPYKGGWLYRGTGGSHGYNVRTSAGVNYFMVTSHQSNSLRGVNGSTGDTLFQPCRPEVSQWCLPAVGVITVNPPWDTTCDPDPITGDPIDYCTKADVALGTFMPGVVGERKIGTSMNEGKNGASGTQEINGWYPIEGVRLPDVIKQGRNIVHKSGATTGTTTGQILEPRTRIFRAPLCWGLRSGDMGCVRDVWVGFYNGGERRHGRLG